jgi:formate hydrogenlyase subunit 3/multisubunit Na+/H+ antiporter MnhD subunit
MVNPIYILILSLVIGFLLTIIDKAGRKLSLFFLYGVLSFNVAVMFIWFYQFAFVGRASLMIHTAGFIAPISINLKLGLLEAFVLLLANLAGLMSAMFLFKKLKETHISGLILYLVLIMGVNGLVMTRDLFNMFVFIEILSISTYALISIDENKRSFSAGFKYMIAGGITSTFFLLGIIFIYYFTGNLNLDTVLGNSSMLAMKTGVFSIFLLIVSIFIELKPFPANGWALDVYQAVNSGITSVIAVVNSAAILFVFYKILPLLPDQYLMVFVGAGIVTFLFSNLIGIKQTDPKRLLGYSSIAQMGLVVAAISYTTKLNISQNLVFIMAGGIFINH